MILLVKLSTTNGFSLELKLIVLVNKLVAEPPVIKVLNKIKPMIVGINKTARNF